MGAVDWPIVIGCMLLCLHTVLAQSGVYSKQTPRWEWSPPLESLANGDQGSYLNLSSNIDLWYTTFGSTQSNNTPVLLLHGGGGNSNQMFNQANYLAKTRKVILQDTRGQGRSPYRGFTDLHYDDVARDAIALLDHLNIPTVAVVGWSDGAITGLNLAMNYSSRIERVFAHGANVQANQGIPGTNDPIINSKSGSFDADFNSGGTTHSTKGDLRKRASADNYSCQNLSPTPDQCAASTQAVQRMWSLEPTWGPQALAQIKCPVWSVDGDHDTEVERNQADTIAAWTPFAGQLILPQVGHAAHLQDPTFFNFAMGYFLNLRYDDVLPYYGPGSNAGSQTATAT